ncbi:conserved hypothetical protein [Mesorhizobium metallidurans STM 2683]|uniref:OsmC family protein n=1 Tax=Mesorhizobium metallidurans STM 2683 TaxID=1297569 RepID=M5EQL2_9HYPH|nr:OsmC family protein [Mesorhizobium metallidurans]CCV06373.1 conserved hypothetical protein [Mesorhizobium metallidurans STM 2683]
MINGIDVAGLDAAKDAIRQSPPAGVANYGVALKWKSGTQIEAEALAMSVGSDRIERKFKWTIDEPPQLLGSSLGPTPQEYLMSGVAACIMVGFVVNASIRGIEIEDLSIRMEGGLDLAGFLNLRPDAQIKMSGLTYEIEVRSKAERSELEEIAGIAFAFSPNAMTVANGAAMTGKLKVLQ